MEENFRIIYQILKTLERSMDADEMTIPTAGMLHISQARWNRLMEMLIDEGYVKGVRITKDIAGNVFADMPDPAITMKGLEFLTENTLMKRAMKASKGIKESFPGL